MGEKIEKKPTVDIYRYISSGNTGFAGPRSMGSNYQIELIELIDFPGLMKRTCLVRDPRRYCWDFCENFGNRWELKKLWMVCRYFYIGLFAQWNLHFVLSRINFLNIGCICKQEQFHPLCSINKINMIFIKMQKYICLKCLCVHMRWSSIHYLTFKIFIKNSFKDF